MIRIRAKHVQAVVVFILLTIITPILVAHYSTIRDAWITGVISLVVFLLTLDEVRRALHRFTTARPIVSLFVLVVIGASLGGVAWLVGYRHASGADNKTDHQNLGSPRETGMVTMSEAQFRSLMEAISKQPPAARNKPQSANADLEYVFYGKDHLYAAYKNISSRNAASKPKISFGLMDLTNPYFYSINQGEPPTPQPFPIPTKVLSNDYVRPGEASTEDVLQNFMSHIKKGDVIFGVALLTCINCTRNRAYYVCWRAGEGGWYAEHDPKHLQLPKPVATAYSEVQINEYLEKLVPIYKRHSIKETFE